MKRVLYLKSDHEQTQILNFLLLLVYIHNLFQDIALEYGDICASF